jgi:hypothetical protein
MPAQKKSRKLEVYAIHLRNEDQAVEYGPAFQAIADAPLDERQFQAGDKLVALSRATISPDSVELATYEGPVGVNPVWRKNQNSFVSLALR